MRQSILIVILLLIPIIANAQTAEEYNKKGEAKFSMGDYKGAILDFNKAIQLEPNHADAYLGRGNAKSELGDYKGAIQDYNKAIEINPEEKEDKDKVNLWALPEVEDEPTHVDPPPEYSDEDIAEIQAYKNELAGEREAEAERIHAKYENFTQLQPFSSVYKPDTRSTYESVASGALEGIGLPPEWVSDKPMGGWDTLANLAGMVVVQIATYPYLTAWGLLAKALPALKASKWGRVGLELSADTANDAEAYANRGMAKLVLGQKDSGCLDLSKAGEMGYMDAYDYIKEYCQ